MTVVNPFITQGYLSPHYFCDRVEETKYLTDLSLTATMSPLSPRAALGTYSVYDNFFAMWLMQQ